MVSMVVPIFLLVFLVNNKTSFKTLLAGLN